MVPELTVEQQEEAVKSFQEQHKRQGKARRKPVTVQFELMVHHNSNCNGLRHDCVASMTIT